MFGRSETTACCGVGCEYSLEDEREVLIEVSADDGRIVAA